MSALKQRVFVAYSHGSGISKAGWGCAVIHLDENTKIRTSENLSAIAAMIKKASPDLTYSNVFVTAFLVIPSIAEDKEVTWMVTYSHAGLNYSGIGMMAVKIIGPFDLSFLIEMIRKQGIENPVVINLQPLDLD